MHTKLWHILSSVDYGKFFLRGAWVGLYCLLLPYAGFASGGQPVSDTLLPQECETGKEYSWWLLDFGEKLRWQNDSLKLIDTTRFVGLGECSATIADTNGELLLFYTGFDLYNRQGNRIKGSPQRLWRLGSASRTQCALLRQPGQDSIYYLFYGEEVEHSLDTAAPLYYGIIDMTGDGGLGELLSYDHLLLNASTEAIAVARHCNDRDWWIIGQESGSNCYYVWLLDSNGLQSSAPQISCTGYVNSGTESEIFNMIHISHDQSRMAVENYRKGRNNDIIQLMDFDNATGTISHARTIASRLDGLYGAEFSPDNSVLYARSYKGLHQWDLSRSSGEAIRQSVQLVKGFKSNAGALTLGPDDRIYGPGITGFSTGTSYYLIIDSPNVIGTGCNVRLNGYLLPKVDWNFGMTNFPSGRYHPERLYIRGPRTLCRDSIAKLWLNCGAGPQQWSYPPEVERIREDGDTIWLRFPETGRFEIKAERETPCGVKAGSWKIQVHCCGGVPGFDWVVGPDTICAGEELSLSWHTGGQHLLLTDEEGDTAGVGIDTEGGRLRPDSSTRYRLFVQDSTGCDTTIYFEVAVVYPYYERDSILLCPGDSVMVFDSWVRDTGMYEQRQSGKICDTIRRVYVSPTPAIDALIRVDTSCSDEGSGHIRITPRDSSAGYTIRWKDGHAGEWTRPDLEPGPYEAVLTDTYGCERHYSIEVPVYGALDYEVKVEDERCYASSDGAIRVMSRGAVRQIYIDGVATAESAMLSPGRYLLRIEDIHGCTYRDTVLIKAASPILVTLPESYEKGSLDTIELETNAVDARPYHYRWHPSDGLGCDTCARTRCYTDHSRSYEVEVSDSNGCTLLLYTEVMVKDQPSLYLPNTITANGDGINDTWKGFSSASPLHIDLVEIYDRWGERIHAAEDIDLRPAGVILWDGTRKDGAILPGVYVYRILYHEAGATGDIPLQKQLYGSLTVLR